MSQPRIYIPTEPRLITRPIENLKTHAIYHGSEDGSKEKAQWDLGPYKTTLLNQKVSGLVVGLSPTAELSQSLNWVVVNDLHEAGKFDI